MMLNENRLFRKSHFLQVLKSESKKRAVIWHSLFGFPQIVSFEALRLLDLFSVPQKLNLVLRECNIPKSDLINIKRLIDAYYLVPVDFKERSFLNERLKKREETLVSGFFLNYLGLIISRACNFRCSYCMHFENLKESDLMLKNPKIMDFTVGKRSIDFFAEMNRLNKRDILDINFGGGEPLLGWKTIANLLEYCKKKYSTDFDLKFSINTNSSLINAEIAKTLKKYKVEIASSIDGLKKANDKVRIDSNGKGTFGLILKGLEELKNQNYPIDGFSITISKANFADIDESVINWAKNQKMKEISIDVDVVGLIDIDPEEVAEKLMKLRKYARSQDINIPGFWQRPVENLNDSIIDSHLGFCGAVRGNSICVDPSGNILPCGYSNKKIGSINRLDHFLGKNSSYFHFTKNHFIGKLKSCRNCIIEGQCGGGCEITREYADKKTHSKISYMCSLYKEMTRKILLEQLEESKNL